MDDEPEDAPTPWWRYALAFTLGGSILAMTYVLFDEDLGTSVPVFQEFTCKGDLQLEILNGFYEPQLQVPESGVRVNATGDGALRPILAVIMKREAGGEWQEYLRAEAPTGSGVWFVTPTTPQTEVRIDARDLEGVYCAASAFIRAASA